MRYLLLLIIIVLLANCKKEQHKNCNFNYYYDTLVCEEGHYYIDSNGRKFSTYVAYTKIVYFIKCDSQYTKKYLDDMWVKSIQCMKENE